MIEFYIDTRVDLKTVFPHGPLTLSALTLQGIARKLLLGHPNILAAVLLVYLSSLSLLVTIFTAEVV
jgi:hypothetical protein